MISVLSGPSPLETLVRAGIPMLNTYESVVLSDLRVKKPVLEPIVPKYTQYFSTNQGQIPEDSRMEAFPWGTRKQRRRLIGECRGCFPNRIRLLCLKFT